MTAQPVSIALPEPCRTRWQPLRVGLVELYYYDCEEFWFRDGHLLLRGNNGTGKSKVLSLTLPFLLDANLGSGRIEPDGDRGKSMEWNLLMGRHDRRTGYAWIEFGRVDESGAQAYLTLGCGLHAIAGRKKVDSWYFITEQRVGEDLWLIGPDRVVLGHERLVDKLAGRGQLFPTAYEYRRAVDQRLFRMGEERYGSLMDTLIMLRQPQLSRQPNETNLSNALTESLAPLPQATLEDVAEAMTQLDEYQDALASQEALKAAVSGFGRKYRVYSRIQARRQAKVLRQAQTEFDNASHVLIKARSGHAAAEAAVTDLEARQERVDLELGSDRAALDELRKGPVMQEAGRLQSAKQTAEEHAQAFASAIERLEDAKRQLTYERTQAANRRAEASQVRTKLEKSSDDGMLQADAVGLKAEHIELVNKLEPLAELVGWSKPQFDRLAASFREAVDRRWEHIGRIRTCIGRLGEAAVKRDQCESARQDRVATMESALERARAADAKVQEASNTLMLLWTEFARSLSVMRFDPAAASLDELSIWVESLAGVNPMNEPVALAQQISVNELASQEAALDQQLDGLCAESKVLNDEHLRLEMGEQLTPPVPYTRGADARTGVQGAPFWQLVDFRHDVPHRARGLLEAALESSGLLDAWVTTSGKVLEPDTPDLRLIGRSARQCSLRDWLVPAQQEFVAASVIEEILESVECGVEDSFEAEAWISPEGRFRLGPATGAYQKPDAQFIGFAAREASRKKRLEEIAKQLSALDLQTKETDRKLKDIRERQVILAKEVARIPGDGELRDAHARFSAEETNRREAQERLASADAQWSAAAQAWRTTLDILTQDAHDLGLPAEQAALDAYGGGLGGYVQCTAEIVFGARECARAQSDAAVQEDREIAAQRGEQRGLEEHQRMLRLAHESAARRDEIIATVGIAVEALMKRVSEKETAVKTGEKSSRSTGEALSRATEARGASKANFDNAQSALEGRQVHRQHSVDKLKAFASTGLLSIAIPDLAIPDLGAPWTIEPALSTARRIEQVLADVSAEDKDWERVQNDLSRDFSELTRTMSAQGHQAQADLNDYGMIVHIVYQNRPERPDILEERLDSEIAQRREVLTAKERTILENHLQAEVAASLQRLLQDAERRVRTINAELDRRPTSTGVRFRLDWQPLPEGQEGAPVGLAAARSRLLKTSADAWSVEDRRQVGEFLQNRIRFERSRDDGVALIDHLSRAMDYRRWHQFRVKRFQDGQWRPLSGPASSGERALGLTVPLFAAASSHYATGEYVDAPRLVLLDEAFAGIDDEARAHCMALIREFDLDFVMTSEREWGCYAELPGLAICNLVRREGIDAVFVSRWTWDGNARQEEADPSRRFPEAAAV